MKFVYANNEYEIKLGDLVSIKDTAGVLGDEVFINNNEGTATLTIYERTNDIIKYFVKTVNGKTLDKPFMNFPVEEETTVEVSEEEIEEVKETENVELTEEDIDFSKLKKSELLSYATEHGFKASDSMTKKQILDMIAK